MNTKRLRELVDKLIAIDERLAISATLAQATSAMEAVVSQPGAPEHQTQYASVFQTLREKVAQMLAFFEPAEFELMDEIKARPLFGSDFTEEIVNEMRNNGVTPAVVRDSLTRTRDSRTTYMGHLTALRDQLQAVGIVAQKLEPGTAELGILLPRTLFDNRFDDLVRHLGVVNKVLRIVSEVATGSAQPIEVDQISTTDPTFYLGMVPDVAIAVGGCVTWALHTWKSIENIRKLRAEVRKLDAEGKQELETQFEKMIGETLDKAVKTQLAELLAASRATQERKHELGTGLEWALEQILSRVERGMTVELRLEPPKAANGAPPIPEEQIRQFQALQELAKQLRFPAANPEPIRPLPPPDPPPGAA